VTDRPFGPAPGSPRELYIDLMKRVLVNWPYIEDEENLNAATGGVFEVSSHVAGVTWPRSAHTMVGVPRLSNVQYCVETVLREGVRGDFLEAGVWRGGVAIFMRAILKAHDVTDRTVWLADSFQGLPPSNPEKYPHDRGLDLDIFPQLAVSLEQVRSNFDRYGLLDDQVRFLKGWFRDTLPSAPVQELAVLRLDGDLYESTIDTLNSLYPKVALGGFAIVDDYGCVPAARAAVDDYRRAQNINAPLVDVDWTGVYWRKV
jgi:hypothetical protein